MTTTIPMSDLLFFGYYTINSPYENEFKELEKTFKQFNLNYEYLPKEGRGNWIKNTQMKAEVVLHFLKQYPGRRLCYMDVDSLILRAPDLLKTFDSDVAAVMLRDKVLLSGVVLFQSKPCVIELAEKWIQMHKDHPAYLPDGRETWDQRTLQMLIETSPEIRFLPLPYGYNYIDQISSLYHPDVLPTIRATRAAHRFRPLIDEGK